MRAGELVNIQSLIHSDILIFSYMPYMVQNQKSERKVDFHLFPNSQKLIFPYMPYMVQNQRFRSRRSEVRGQRSER
jgi:hypothetical protein